MFFNKIVFGSERVTVQCADKYAQELLDILCIDLDYYRISATADDYPHPHCTFSTRILREKTPEYRLSDRIKELYRGNCPFEAAYELINAILYAVIVDNCEGLIFHGAGINTNNGGILIPGKSGSGKSTLTSWLIATFPEQFYYLTDELVMLRGENPEMIPFTRPISIKTGSFEIIKKLLNGREKGIIAGSKGMMIPHRNFNAAFRGGCPQLSMILFSEYKSTCTTTIKKLSSGLGSAMLMEHFVNSRNLPGNGIDKLSAICRNTPVYQLKYSSFTHLKQVLLKSFPKLFYSQ